MTTYAANNLNQYSLISNHVNLVNPVQILPSYDLNGNLTWDGTNAYFWDVQIKRAPSPRRSRRATATLRPRECAERGAVSGDAAATDT